MPIQFSYEITLAGNPGKSHPGCDRVEYVPFYVHPISQMKKRIDSVTKLGIVRKPRWGEGLLLSRSTRKNDPIFYNNRGEVYLREGKFDEAIDDFNTAIEIQPEFVAAYNNRGLAYGRKGENDLAINDFNTAIELQPEFAEAYNNRANVYDDKDDFEKAIADFNTAITLKPDFVETNLTRQSTISPMR